MLTFMVTVRDGVWGQTGWRALGISIALAVFILLAGGMKCAIADADEENDDSETAVAQNDTESEGESQSNPDEFVEEETEETPKPQVQSRRPSQSDDGMSVLFRIGVSEGQGITQNRSLVPLELFPYILEDDSLYFTDFRFYSTYDLTLGGSGGLGYRRYSSGMDRIWGISGWYDADGSREDHYFQQVGLSLETYGDLLDFRTNFYLPVGDTYQQSSLRLIDNSTRFSGENVLYDQMRSFYSAMRGFDLEAGIPLPGRFVEEHGVRIYGGMYHYDDDHDGNITGGSARIAANIVSGLDVGVQVTNDSFYDTRAFVNVAWTFGPLHRSQMSQRSIRGRLGEHVTRNYSVLAPVRSSAERNIIASDPNTGTPYTFAHVSSAAAPGGTGTVTSPFQTIAAAQSAGKDIIFVHAGSVFSGADATIALNSGERILGDGAGIQHYVQVAGLDSLLLPHGPTGGSAPILDASLGDAVTLASNSELSGFMISNSVDDGVFGSWVSNVVLHDVSVQNAGGIGMHFVNTAGSVSIADAVISNGAGDGLVIDGGNASVRFTGLLSSNSGHDLVVENTAAGGNANLTGVNFSGTGSQGILVDNVAGNVQFQDVSLDGTTGKGIEINGVSGAVQFGGTTTVSGAGGASIEIADLAAAGSVAFDAVSIQNRQDAGFVIDNASGVVQVNGSMAVANQSGDTASAIDIENSSGRLAFGNVAVYGSTGDPGVHIENNTAVTSFNRLDISSNGGTALFAMNAGTLLINPTQASNSGGDIVAVNGTAVDIENTTVSAYLRSVSSSGATVGVRLVTMPGVFSVAGNGTTALGTGGTIQGATTGILLQDVGTVGLVSMNIVSNGVGIQSTDVDNLGLMNFQVTNSTTYGLDALNTRNLVLSYSTFSGNGLDDVHAAFSEVASNTYTFYNNAFTTTTGDSIQLESQVGSAGAIMSLASQLNNFNNTFAGGGALNIDWNGAITTGINQNSFVIGGSSGYGIDIVNASTTAGTVVNMNSNQALATGANATVLHVVADGSSQIGVGSNIVQFNAIGGTGARFDLAASASVNILSNAILDTTDGATAMLFDSLVGPSTVAINNNAIQFADGGALVDRGIIFSSVTTPTIGSVTYYLTLSGTQTNAIVGADTNFSAPANTTTGHLIINNLLAP